MSRKDRTRTLLLSLLGLLGLFGSGILESQSPQSPPSSAPAFTLRTESRIVLTDVTVIGRDGNPVHGLPSSAFQIFDDGHPQHIASFEEHTGGSTLLTSAPASPSGVYSNDFSHLPPVLNVLLLDTTNLPLTDQMYLRLQLDKFVAGLPAGQPIAVYERHGDSGVLLQSFTTDHGLLLAAIHRALPRMLPTGREYLTDVDTLHQIAVELSEVPGRKNVLWFSGGSTSFLMSGLAALMTAAPSSPSASPAPMSSTSFGENDSDMREVFDELETARIAVYPVDARGLMTSTDSGLPGQQALMDQIATATGGHAFFNTNGLALAASRVVSTDSSAYTLTYSPANFRYNKKWHSVRVTVAGPYHLSYRRGYFADPLHTPPTGNSRKRLALLANGATPAAAPEIRSSPILFHAAVHSDATATPAAQSGFVVLRSTNAPRHGATTFDIDYSIPTSALQAITINDTPSATLVLAVIAFSSEGTRMNQTLDRIRFALKPDEPARLLKVRQYINLSKGASFLMLVLWDTGSGRLGMLQIPLPSKSR